MLELIFSLFLYFFVGLLIYFLCITLEKLFMLKNISKEIINNNRGASMMTEIRFVLMYAIFILLISLIVKGLVWIEMMRL